VRAIFKILLIASLCLALGLHISLFLPLTIAGNSGWSIDLFCQHGGVGNNVTSSSPFIVGDLTILFAYVTYNQVPVQSILVAFQLNNPQDSLVLVTTAQTNASGIAATNFTITENVYPVFPSVWKAIATASPAQQTVSDTMLFSVIERLTVAISPTSVSIAIGNSVYFISTVNGGIAPYYYQWYLNGTAVSGATNPTWMFTPASIGVYYIYLNVTDSIGAKAKSNVALVTVIAMTYVVGGRSTSADASNFFAPWLCIILLLALVVMLKGIIVRKRGN
jgi:hypothetical protein